MPTYRRKSKSRRRRRSTRQTTPDRILNVAKYVLIVVLILFFISRTREMYRLGYSIFSPTAYAEAGQGKTVTITITDGMSDSDVGDLLENEGLVESSFVFRMQMRFSDYEGKLKAGTYTLSSDMLPEEMMQIMSGESGDSDDSGDSESM